MIADPAPRSASSTGCDDQFIEDPWPEDEAPPPVRAMPDRQQTSPVPGTAR